jgi:GNAT superfamily N-acetyltransferase
MDRAAMKSFVSTDGAKDQVGSKTNTMASSKASMNRDYVEQTVRECLHTTAKEGQKLKLRLAGPEDVDAMARLVQGLAVFEKEPDAVHVTTKDYLLDGLESDEPLFYCLLVDDVNGVGKKSTSCGIGLFYFGYILGEGRFLYLEDLFIEEAHRGKGGGKAIMESLAQVALALDCSKFTWSALDWNTPALAFYNKIGAKLGDANRITRYCGKELQSFAKGTARSLSKSKPSSQVDHTNGDHDVEVDVHGRPSISTVATVESILPPVTPAIEEEYRKELALKEAAESGADMNGARQLSVFGIPSCLMVICIGLVVAVIIGTVLAVIFYDPSGGVQPPSDAPSMMPSMPPNSMG